MLKKSCFFIVMFVLVVAFAACGGGSSENGGISGTWTRQAGWRPTVLGHRGNFFEPRIGIDLLVELVDIPSFVFTGNSFTLHHDYFVVGERGGRYIMGDAHGITGLFSTDDEIKGLPVDISDFDVEGEGWRFLDRRGWQLFTHSLETTGTFSLMDGQIEFILSDGTILTRDFSRTENTITIGSDQFVREQ